MVNQRSLETPTEVIEFCKAIKVAGGIAYIVGGWVRDSILDIESKDIDIEVYQLEPEKLEEVLKAFNGNDKPGIGQVGASFGVWKCSLGRLQCDVSLPRSEIKSAVGHTGFTVTFDSQSTPHEAALRRDFTINALLYDPLEEVILDYFNGLSDIKAGVLSHISCHFGEDPLRVLRGMQFCSRFNLKPSQATLEVCKGLEGYNELSKERIFEEWAKWARGRKPSAGLEFLRGSGWIKYYPELQALETTHQNPRYHEEDTVWAHTLLTVDAMISILQEENITGDDQTTLMLAALCHDMGKPEATHWGRGSNPETPEHWRSPGHAKNIFWAIKFLNQIGISPEANLNLFQRIIPLCKEHMVHLDTVPSVAQARRLSIRLQPENIRNLLRLAKADRLGSICKENSTKFEDQLLAAAQQAEALDAAPKPILMGRHLLDSEIMKRIGKSVMTPGPEMGKLLKQAFQEQLDGKFTDLEGAIQWFSQLNSGLAQS